MRRDSSHSALNWQSASFHAVLMHGRDTTKDRKRSLIGSIIGSVIDMEEEDMDESMGAVETAINLVKCAAGCGMFSLPYAYKQGGLYLSIAGTLFFGLVSAYTVQFLAAAEASPPPPQPFREIHHMSRQPCHTYTVFV